MIYLIILYYHVNKWNELTDGEKSILYTLLSSGTARIEELPVQQRDEPLLCTN